jgi:hypothetical protein
VSLNILSVNLADCRITTDLSGKIEYPNAVMCGIAIERTDGSNGGFAIGVVCWSASGNQGVVYVNYKQGGWKTQQQIIDL